MARVSGAVLSGCCSSTGSAGDCRGESAATPREPPVPSTTVTAASSARTAGALILFF